MDDMICGLCERDIYDHEPRILFASKYICSNCYIDLIPKIYEMAGMGDGGIIHLVFNNMVQSFHNRKKKPTVKQYKSVFKKLLHKYNFKCVECNAQEKLSIDHIQPVSKGGSDDLSNLQILCRSCNSKKGAKWEG
jgi:hypothetical protein